MKWGKMAGDGMKRGKKLLEMGKKMAWNGTNWEKKPWDGMEGEKDGMKREKMGRNGGKKAWNGRKWNKRNGQTTLNPAGNKNPSINELQTIKKKKLK